MPGRSRQAHANREVVFICCLFKAQFVQLPIRAREARRLPVRHLLRGRSCDRGAPESRAVQGWTSPVRATARLPILRGPSRLAVETGGHARNARPHSPERCQRAVRLPQRAGIVARLVEQSDVDQQEIEIGRILRTRQQSRHRFGGFGRRPGLDQRDGPKDLDAIAIRGASSPLPAASARSSDATAAA